MAAYDSKNLPFFKPNETITGSLVKPAVDTGYDIRAVRIHAKRRERALKRANGILSNEREKVVFFATDFEVDIGLAGVTGQGRRTRDFYAHNIIMPTFKVTGQCLDQQDYATVVEFIHKTQQDAVGNIKHGNLIQLDILDVGLPGGHTMRGRHKPVQAQGFVEAIQRKHEQGVYAPKFTFNMAVTRSIVGIYEEIKEYPLRELKEQGEIRSWWEILEGQKPFSQAPKTKTAKNTQPVSQPAAQPSAPPQKPAENIFGPLPESALETFTPGG